MAADARVIDMSDLKDLEPLSKRLNAASDELTKALESIQQKLNDLALGVEVWLIAKGQALEGEVVSESETLQTWDYKELGYGRLGDGWALLVRTARWTTDPRDREAAWEFVSELDRKPLLRTSRHLRVESIDLIPTLIDWLRLEAERIIGAVEQAKKIADSIK